MKIWTINNVEQSTNQIQEENYNNTFVADDDYDDYDNNDNSNDDDDDEDNEKEEKKWVMSLKYCTKYCFPNDSGMTLTAKIKPSYLLSVARICANVLRD